MNAVAALAAITAGDFVALINALDVDTRRDLVISPPPIMVAMGAESFTATIARMGVVVIHAVDDKIILHGPHDNEADAAECYASLSGAIDESVRRAEDMGATVTDSAYYSPVVEAEGIITQR